MTNVVLALLVHTAEPTCVGKQLTPLPVPDGGGLAYRIGTPQRRQGSPSPGITIGFVIVFFSLAAPKRLNEPAGMARETIGLP
jgi:hypothetical protein